MVVYFSGTGNSKYVAERIAGSLQEKLICMNERIKSGDTGSVKTGENLVVVVPTYAWRIPRVVSDWIGQTEFVGAKNVWYVMSCGSGIGGADIYNRKLSEKKGLKHMGTAQIIMPENYIAMFNAPDVEKAKKIVAAAGPDIAKAVLAIKHGEKLPSKSGFGASFESGLVNDIFYAAFVKAKAFYADQTCTGCGKCVKVCPLNNVTMKNKKPVWEKHCTHCMACICYCPAEAIEYGRKINIPYLKNKKEEILQPVFTDVMELEKFTKGQKLRIAKVPFAKLPELLIDKAMAYAVNPLGFNLVLNREQLNKIIGLK